MIPVPSGVRVWLAVGERPLRLAIADGRRSWDLGLAVGVHARWNRLAESASYVSSGACGIVADASIFDESSANICDSIWAWIRVVKPLQMTLTR
jgi:hypothetical protein